MMNSRKDWERDYRTIYDTFWENPRCSDSVITTLLGARIAAARLKMAYESGYTVGPDIRKRSYENLKEYMYFIKSRDPELLYMKLREDPNIIYHAKAIGFCNMWIIAKKKIDIKGEIILEGHRSDYYTSYATDRTWETALKIMQEKIETFRPETCSIHKIILTHFDDEIDWDFEDESLYRYFKYDLRKPFTPLAREGLSKEKADEFFNNLPNTCTVATHYYPDSLPMYNYYLFMFETDYEDFIINLFSELSSSVSFFKVSNRLFASIHVPQQVMRNQDLKVAPKRSYIPLLLIDLLERGIIKFKDYSIVEYFWAKDL